MLPRNLLCCHNWIKLVLTGNIIPIYGIMISGNIPIKAQDECHFFVKTRTALLLLLLLEERWMLLVL